MMNGRAGKISRRVLALLVAALLVAGLVPALPEAPFALAEPAEGTVELVGGERSPEGGAAGASAVEGALGGGDAQVSDGQAGSDDGPIASPESDAVVLDEDVGEALLDGLALKVLEEDASAVESAPADGPALAAQAVDVSNPRVRADSKMKAGQVVTWDCLWFGSYPQTEVAPGDSAYASLQSAVWDANGDATVGGRRYRRVSKSDATYRGYWSDDGYGSATWRYFRYEPIKWRVLKAGGGKALVVSDVALDDQGYNANYTSVTWDTSSVRSWLNGYGAASNQPGTDFSRKNFVGTAFSASERSAILTTDVANANNTYYGTAGGSNTKDKVFLLSEAEVYDSSYGFADKYDTFDEARRCKPTDYARSMGTYKYSGGAYDGNCCWWLRSPGIYSDYAAFVPYVGYVRRFGDSVCYGAYAVRPALNLNLASSHLSWAGTVSSNGDVNEQATIDSGDIGVHKGTCGELLDWRLEKGVLSISGFGKMTSHPWSQFRNEITSVTLPWGVLNICDGAFQGCGSLASVSVPSSLEEVGDSAFEGCASLADVYYFGESERNWSDVRIGQRNEPLLNAIVTQTRGAVKKRVYDMPLYVRTPEDKVQQAAFAFEAASDDYMKAVGKAAENQAKSARSKCKKTNGELLEEVGGNKSLNMLTLNPQMPKAYRKAAYSGLAKYLDKYVEKGTGIIGGIDVSTDYISVSASTVNWIRMNLNNWADDEFMVDGHKVEINIACSWGSAGVGYLTVDGLYMSSICTTPEDTAKVLSAYLNKLKEAELDAAYNVLTSVCGEFADATGISSWTKDKITSFLKNKVSVLKSKGFGDVLDGMICAREGCYLARELVIASDTVSIAKALTNPKALADSITSIDITDKGVTEMLVKRAIKRLKQARDLLAKSIYDYAVDPKKQEVKPWFDNVVDGLKDLAWKIITCQCPVDVYVYDAAGNELGHVAGGEVVCSDDIAMKLDGDVKTIVVPSDVEASVKLVGTDEGEMTYVVEQMVDGEVTGRANWYGVPLTEGTTYSQAVSSEPLTGKSKVSLKSNEGVSISASEYLSADESASVQI